MFVYKVETGEKFCLKTPGDWSLSDIKKEELQKADLIVIRSTYPNGFVIEFEQHPGFVVYRTNRELIDNGNGDFTAPDR